VGGYVCTFGLGGPTPGDFFLRSPFVDYFFEGRFLLGVYSLNGGGPDAPGALFLAVLCSQGILRMVFYGCQF